MGSRLSLQAKLVSASVFLSLIVVALGLIGTGAVRTVSETYRNVSEITVPNLVSVNQMALAGLDLNRLALRLYVAHGKVDLKPYLAEVEKNKLIYGKAERQYEAVPFFPGEKEKYDALKSAWVPYSAAVTEIGRVISEQPEQLKSPEFEALMHKRLPSLRQNFASAINELIVYHDTRKTEFVAAADTGAATGSKLMWVAALVGFVVSIIGGIWFSRGLSATIRNIADQLTSSTEFTSSASAQLSSSSQQLSSGATEAASSLEETVASLEELSSMVSRNANAATEANSLSQRSRDSAAQGEKEIAKLIEAMSDLARGSKKIEEITNVIDDIAFQTNLLALNAAVEAARAGEQGKGFAVVAEAVRTLAQRSGEAAKEINSLIKENVAKSENGSVIAGQSGQVLRDIVTSVMKVADLNNEIATASQEQSTGINQISKAMNQLDQATQTNAASSEEVAAAAEEMSGQARALQGTVFELKVLIEGRLASAAFHNEAVESRSTGKHKRLERARPSRQVSVTGASGPTKTSPKASNVIPFDDDDSSGVGDAQGF